MRTKISLVILIATTIFSPIYYFFSWDKESFTVLLIPLFFQLLSYVCWFKKIKPWVLKRTNGSQDQEAVILASTGVFLSFCITFIHLLLPYCLGRNHLIDNHTILLVGLFSASIWYMLFFASLQSKLLYCPKSITLWWGKIMPFSFGALMWSHNILEAVGRNLTVMLVFSVFFFECILAFIYNYWRYGRE